ncbi:MAG: ABC transporter ATP-binding protein [Planctomycetes bacterium]|nr:ABC transporter ATP-binding protein [Planctomycetota bacterium]
MDEPIIQTHEVVKVFKDFWHRPRVKAVDNLTLSVSRGEVYGLLGPNGSGKSTTIKMLLGLLFPTSGQIAIFGKPPSDVAVKKRIGFLPEESYLYPYLNAVETLDFYGRLFSLPGAERKRRVESLLRMTGLSGARGRLLREYSKGMARRIGIAQAMINDPELIILDEPTTGLDPLGTREIKDLILELKDKGKTVLLCSHLLADVEDVCDRVGILYGGRLQAEGQTTELLRQDRQTQITAELDDKTLQEALALIRKRQGDAIPIKVAPPIERLENFFLRVVEEARTAEQPTSGVEEAVSGLDFLSDADKDKVDVFNRLSAPKPLPVKVMPVASPAGTTKKPSGTKTAEQKILSNLTAPRSMETKPEPKKKTAGKSEAGKPLQADSKVLNRLLDQDSSKRQTDKK